MIQEWKPLRDVHLLHGRNGMLHDMRSNQRTLKVGSGVVPPSADLRQVKVGNAIDRHIRRKQHAIREGVQDGVGIYHRPAVREPSRILAVRSRRQAEEMGAAERVEHPLVLRRDAMVRLVHDDQAERPMRQQLRQPLLPA